MTFQHGFARTLAASAMMLGAASAANAVSVVNLDGPVNASVDGSNAITIALPGGRYEARFIEDLFTAHNRFGGSVAGCVDGTNCVRGWETNARIFVGDNDFDTANDIRLGNFTYHATPELAFAASSAFVSQFIVPTGGSTVSFYIFDTKINDNVGGVSIGVAAVPEMATWAMLIAGFGMVGVAARRRRQETAAA